MASLREKFLVKEEELRIVILDPDGKVRIFKYVG